MFANAIDKGNLLNLAESNLFIDQGNGKALDFIGVSRVHYAEVSNGQ